MHDYIVKTDTLPNGRITWTIKKQYRDFNKKKLKKIFLSSLISVAQFAVQRWTVFSMYIYLPVPVYLAWQRQKPPPSVCPEGLPSQRIVPIKKIPASCRMDNNCTPRMGHYWPQTILKIQKKCYDKIFSGSIKWAELHKVRPTIHKYLKKLWLLLIILLFFTVCTLQA